MPDPTSSVSSRPSRSASARGPAAALLPSTRRPLWPTVIMVLAVAGSLGLGALWLGVAQEEASADVASLVLLAPILVVYAVLGWLILRRRPGHRVGWALLWTALLANGAFLGIGLGGAVLPGISDTLAGAAGAIGISLLTPMGMLVFCFLPLLFPDGQLPGSRWRRPTQLLVALTAASTACYLLAPGQLDANQPPNPFGIPGLEILVEIGSALTLLVIPVGGLLGIAAITARFRRGQAEERQQLKWMLAAVVLVVLANVPGFVGVQSDLLGIAGTLVVLLIPVALTLAILRYRLYEIDRLISRTITWALVTAAAVAIFVGGNLALQALLENVTQGGTLAVAASTLLAFAAAQPIWRRLQGSVDHRFDRARFDAAQMATAFAGRQRDRVDLEAVLGDLAGTSRAALRPASVGVWMRDRDTRSGG